MQIRAATREDLPQVVSVRGQAFNIAAEEWPAPDEIRDEELEFIRVVSVDGRIVSCLTILPMQIYIAVAKVPMGGIGQVATLAEERNKGYASALMRDTLRELRRRGLCTSALFPFSFSYYRKFGYELGGNHCQFWSRPANIPAFRERQHCRPASGDGDLALIGQLYERHCRVRSCSVVRTPDRWSKLLNGNGKSAVLYDQGNARGYLIYSDEIDYHGARVLRVQELVSTDPESARGLVGYLAGFEGDSVEWSTTAADLSGVGLLSTVAPLREGYKPRGIATVRPMFQFRVVDVLDAVKSRSPDWKWLEGELSLVVRDEINAENATPVAIGCKDGTVQIVRGHRTEHCLEADIRLFSQLFCGYLTPTEAASQGLIQISSPDLLPLADQMFPKLEPFIPEMDRF
jgi:predicted acetyltransferase